jgi:hypothetical protein
VSSLSLSLSLSLSRLFRGCNESAASDEPVHRFVNYLSRPSAERAMADMQSRDLLDDGFPIRIQWGKRQATAGKLHPSNHRKHKKKVSWMWSLTSFRDASASDDSANSAATAATAPTAHAAASCHGIHAAAAADRRAPADAGPRTNGRPSSDGHPAVDGHDPAHGNATSSPSWRATRAAATRTRKRGMCYTSFSLSLCLHILLL